MPLPHDIDIHAHTGPLRNDAIVCVDPTQSYDLPPGEGLISVGVHPWNAALATEDTWRKMEGWLDDPRVKAVGEIGFDRMKGPDIDVQSEIFVKQVKMAEKKQLPVIIHCVRAYDILLGQRSRLIKKDNPQQWIIHGFRGKPAVAFQLLNCGIDLSFGEKHNPESFQITPTNRRYRETDR